MYCSFIYTIHTKESVLVPAVLKVFFSSRTCRLIETLDSEESMQSCSCSHWGFFIPDIKVQIQKYQSSSCSCPFTSSWTCRLRDHQQRRIQPYSCSCPRTSSWTCRLRDPWKQRIQSCSCSCPRTSSWTYRLRDPWKQRIQSCSSCSCSRTSSWTSRLRDPWKRRIQSCSCSYSVPLHGQVGLETPGSGSEESSLVPAVILYLFIDMLA